jgi:2'-5' RNA ligase
LRCFVAIEIPEQIKSFLGEIEERLKKYRADIRWVKPENIHLTLKFMGNTEEANIKKISLVIDEVCHRYHPFCFKVKGIGAFPNKRTPRVLWTGIENNDKLRSLQRDIEDGLTSAGFKKEEKGFSAHITLGRFKSLRGKDVLFNNIKDLEDKEFGSVDVRAVSLMKSDLHPDGARYTRIYKSELKQDSNHKGGCHGQYQ